MSRPANIPNRGDLTPELAARRLGLSLADFEASPKVGADRALAMFNEIPSLQRRRALATFSKIHWPPVERRRKRRRKDGAS